MALLEKRGPQPKVATNGREAFPLLMLALMDVQLPEANGFEATQEIGNYEAQILSGNIEPPFRSCFRRRVVVDGAFPLLR